MVLDELKFNLINITEQIKALIRVKEITKINFVCNCINFYNTSLSLVTKFMWYLHTLCDTLFIYNFPLSDVSIRIILLIIYSTFYYNLLFYFHAYTESKKNFQKFTAPRIIFKQNIYEKFWDFPTVTLFKT